MQCTDEGIEVLPNRNVLVDYGPMRMVIQVSVHGMASIDLAREGACKAKRVLHDMARFLPVLKQKTHGIKKEESFPAVVRSMIEATQWMEEPDLTPLASVAGAASDAVADFLVLQGGTKIIVDNGGDIAIRLGIGERATVGLKTDILHRQPSFILSIDHTMGIGGVATSGLGGRSFTKGIASAATTLSKTASIADAAATVVANATSVEDPNIRKALAENIYPDTDLSGEWVTVEVGVLPPEKIDFSLNQGLQRVDAIGRKGLIKGALIAVQGKVVWTESLVPLLKKV
jgi:hypothetical protein